MNVREVFLQRDTSTPGVSSWHVDARIHVFLWWNRKQPLWALRRGRTVFKGWVFAYHIIVAIEIKNMMKRSRAAKSVKFAYTSAGLKLIPRECFEKCKRFIKKKTQNTIGLGGLKTWKTDPLNPRAVNPSHGRYICDEHTLYFFVCFLTV